MRSTFLPFALPDVGEAEVEAVANAIRSGWLTTGQHTRAFEAAFAKYVGSPHAIAVNSCTAALHLALVALDIQPGDEVITTPITFAATAEVVRYFDATPVLVDVEPTWMNIDPNLIESAITPRTRAIMPVHLAGASVDLAPIRAVAARYGLPIVEDAAHALPTSYQGKRIGSPSPDVPTISCFSFYATKNLTTGEGGMICTDNPDWADRFRIMSLHGISRDAWKRYTAEGSWFYEILAPGYKYNMTDPAAAMGLVQIQKVDAMAERRRAIAARYDAAFADLPVQTPSGPRPGDEHGWHLYTLRLNLDELDIDRGAFIEALKARNIGTSVHFIPLHIHPYYRDTYGFQPEDFPVAHGEYQRLISLPLYSRMSDADVEDVIEAVRAVAVEHAGKRVALAGKAA